MFGRLLLKQYQRVYRFDRNMRRRYTSTGHLFMMLLVASGVYGVDTKASLTYQLFVFLAVVLFAAWILNRFNRCRFSMVRQLPSYATVGEQLSYSVNVFIQGKHKRYTNLALIEELAEPLPSYAELNAFYRGSYKPWYRRGVSFRRWRHYLSYRRGAYINEQALSASSMQTLKISIKPLRRGKLVFEGSYLAKPDALGLFRRLFFLSNQQTLLVLPKRYDIKPLLLDGKRKYQAGGVALANSVGDSAEFMSLRDYRQGDALNHIHWKSFARHGKLIVKEYQDEYFVRRALLLDTYAGALDNDQFEAAVSVAASIAMTERQNDALLDLMFVEQKAYRFTTGRGVDHMPHLQEILASVQARDQDQFALLHNAVLAHAGQCSSLVCVLLHWDASRQQLIRRMRALDIPVAVFLIHDGQLTIGDLADKPAHFYALDYHHLDDELARL